MSKYASGLRRSSLVLRKKIQHSPVDFQAGNKTKEAGKFKEDPKKLSALSSALSGRGQDERGRKIQGMARKSKIAPYLSTAFPEPWEIVKNKFKRK